MTLEPSAGNSAESSNSRKRSSNGDVDAKQLLQTSQAVNLSGTSDNKEVLT